MVPYSDPLGTGTAAAAPSSPAASWHRPAPTPSELSDTLAIRLAYIAGGSVALLALAIVVTALVHSLSPSGGEAVTAETVNRPNLSSSALPPVAPAPVFQGIPPSAAHEAAESPPPAPTAPLEPASASSPLTSTQPDQRLERTIAAPQVRSTIPRQAASPGDRVTSPLPDAAAAWLEQPESRLLGIRRVGTISNPAAHFSWMTGLLPYLDHQDVYDRIDFNQPVTSRVNLQAGGTKIPEFVNPQDDHQTWKGFPLEGLALSHFAGMSGVEDARNVVAAKLPRSDPRAGVFGYDEVARPSDITDGTSQTIMIVGTGAMANPWIMGGGGTIRGAREPLFDGVTGLGTKGLAGGGTLAVMADGSVRHVSAKIDPRVFKAMSTIHGAESVDFQRAAPPYPRDEWKAARRSPATRQTPASYRPATN